VNGLGLGKASRSRARLFSHEGFERGLRVVFEILGEITSGVEGQFAEGLDLALAGVERGFDVVHVEGSCPRRLARLGRPSSRNGRADFASRLLEPQVSFCNDARCAEDFA